jgi:hypothetical protein
MNDFSDLESQLKALRPAPLREGFVARVEQAMGESPAPDESSGNIIRPAQFRSRWFVGLSLAAAAALLLLVRVNFRPPETAKRVASVAPQPAATAAPVQSIQQPLPDTFVPAGSTQVVYHKRDEGLLFAKNGEEPLRRLRSYTQETQQWRNPATGASLQVSYPSEQVELIPISAQ